MSTTETRDRTDGRGPSRARRLLVRCVVSILLIMLLCAGAALAVSLFVPRLYDARAVLTLRAPEAGEMANLESPQTQLAYLQSDAMPGYVRRWLQDSLSDSRKQAALGRDLGGSAGYFPSEEVTALATDSEFWQGYATFVTCSNPEGTIVIVVRAVSSVPLRAAILANAIGHTLEEIKSEVARDRVWRQIAALEAKAEKARHGLLAAEKARARFIATRGNSGGSATDQASRVLVNTRADVARSLYIQTATTLALANLSVGVAVGNVSLAGPAAVPEAPFQPDLPAYLRVAACIGGGLSLVWVLGLVIVDVRRHRIPRTLVGLRV